MSTTAKDAAGIRVSDIVAPDLVITGPYGTGEEMTLRAPWDGAELARIPTATLEDMDRVLDRARVAAEAYRWTPAWKRAAILERASHLIEENAEQIAHIIAAEGGKPLKDARVEAKRGASTFRWASEEAKRTAGDLIEMDADPSGEHRFGWTIREPRGVIAAISPFNFPLNLVSAQGGAGAGRRQRRRAQAGLQHPAHRAAAGGAARRGRPPRRHAAGRGRLGPHHRQQDGHRRAHQHGELHRQPAGRPPDRQRRRHEDDHAGARQQLGDHRRRRRQPRARRAARRGRRVRQLRPDLHLGAARRRPPGGVRRVHGEAHPARRGAQGRRPARRDHRRRLAHQRGRDRARQGLDRGGGGRRARRWRPAACATTAACCRRC